MQDDYPLNRVVVDWVGKVKASRWKNLKGTVCNMLCNDTVKLRGMIKTQ